MSYHACTKILNILCNMINCMSNEGEALSKIGLSKNEIDIYLALLSYKELSSYEIAQKTGIYRPHVYDKLDVLMKKGLVSEVKKGKKKYFKAADPNNIVYFLEEQMQETNEKIENIRKILPKMNSLFESLRERTNVEVYSGKRSIKIFLKDMIKTGENICGMGTEEENYRNYAPIEIQKYFEELKESGLSERIIIKDKPGAFMFDTPTTKYKKLESKVMQLSETYIYGNKVSIIIWGNPITVIKIEDQNVAKTYKENFEYLWKMAKPCRGKKAI